MSAIKNKELIDAFFMSEGSVWKAFGYVEDWKAIPMDDKRGYYWQLHAEGDDTDGSVRYADSLDQLNDIEEEDYYENEIYTQRFLTKYVYRTEGYTMICVDTHTDGNKFLQIFDNALEVPTDGTYTPPKQYPTFELPPALIAEQNSEHEFINDVGSRMGFGRMMQLAQQCWRESLTEQGFSGGEFQIGPCVAGTTQCGCDGDCSWCNGSGWLTKHVKAIKDKRKV